MTIPGDKATGVGTAANGAVADRMAAEREMAARHRRVAARLGVVVVVMAGMAYAAVPLYRMFCQVTGYGGTPQVAAKASSAIVDRTIVVRFDANTARALPWDFQPKQRTVEVRLGENVVAHYGATNISSRRTKGTASFNVAPESAGAYFNKVECFCFTEQVLEPGQSADMPVMFFVDPAILNDPDAKKLSEITLSYTFHPIEEPHAAASRRDVAPAGSVAPHPGGKS